MNVTQFLARLSYGPLSNLSMSNNGDGTIKVERIPAVIGHLNDALLKLYAKFDLKEAELVLEQMATVTSYKLQAKYAVTTAAANPTLDHYIIDSVTRPFTDDLIKVLAVYQTGGAQVPLNDDHHPNSLFTPQYDTLQVPDPEDGAPLYVIYQAKHAIIDDDTTDPTAFGNQQIILPEVLDEALLAYVAHKIYFYMNGQEHAAKAAQHLTTYNNECAEVTDRDLVNTSLSTIGKKFSERGFV